MNYNIQDLLSDARDTLDFEWLDIQKGHYELEETIHEIAENALPVYYNEIAGYAATEHWLMTEIPETCLDGNAHDQIKANIFEFLYNELLCYAFKKQEEDDKKKEKEKK